MFSRAKKEDNRYQRIRDFVLALDATDVDEIRDRSGKLLADEPQEVTRGGKLKALFKDASTDAKAKDDARSSRDNSYVRAKRFDVWLGKSCKHRCTLCPECLEEFRKIISE